MRRLPQENAPPAGDVPLLISPPDDRAASPDVERSQISSASSASGRRPLEASEVSLFTDAVDCLHERPSD